MNTPLGKFPKQVLLSGADCFFLAMEQHYAKYGKAGNVCHLLISPAGLLSKESIAKKIAEFPVFEWMSKIELNRGFFFGIPKWEFNPGKISEIKIFEHTADHYNLPEEVTQNGIFLNDPCLFHFTIVIRPDKSTDLVFSWHHILMDAQGAETLLKLIGGEIKEEKVNYFPEKEKHINPLKAYYKLHTSKEFIKKSSRKPLVQLVDKAPDYIPTARYYVMELSEEETKQLDKRALENGAGVSKGSFYLAAITKTVNEWLVSKGNTKGTFWIPIPQNRRPRGSYGPVLSNLQALMFYRIPREKTTNLKTCTQFIVQQMFDLIRHKIPDDYAVMSGLLRRLPASFYYWLIKGPAGGSVASFVHTDPGINKFNSFFGYPIKNITNYPPATFPPGLITVFERFNNKQKIVINYTEQVVSTEELRILEKNLRKELLGTV
ncbi:MAG TPA: hypothetical protein VNB90_02795 [Cytophagaceae bacterium]|nr:hypothetical protein [Cytophagaceae bacterium]